MDNKPGSHNNRQRRDEQERSPKHLILCELPKWALPLAVGEAIAHALPVCVRRTYSQYWDGQQQTQAHAQKNPIDDANGFHALITPRGKFVCLLYSKAAIRFFQHAPDTIRDRDATSLPYIRHCEGDLPEAISPRQAGLLRREKHPPRNDGICSCLYGRKDATLFGHPLHLLCDLQPQPHHKKRNAHYEGDQQEEHHE